MKNRSSSPRSVEQTTEINLAVQAFLERRRPPVEIRSKVDLTGRLEGKTRLVLYEVRPRFQRPEEIVERPFAKATWVAARGIWRISWMRGNLKWAPYEPRAEVTRIEDFFRTVEEDAHGCFFG